MPAPLTVADAIRHAAKSGFEILFRIPAGLRGIQVSTGDPPGRGTFTVGTWHQSISDEELDQRGDQAIIHAVEIAMHQLEAARAARITELEWAEAARHAIDVKERYTELVGLPGVNPTLGLAVIGAALQRFHSGERTVELYDELRKLE